jgi:hypothetical protein
MWWENKGRAILLALVSLIFLSAIASAQSVCTQQAALVGDETTQQTAHPWYEDVLPIWVMLAVVISSSIIGLGYMLAKGLQLQVVEAWAKLEMSELMISVFIAVFCIALITTVNTAAGFLVTTQQGQSTPDIVCAAQEFLSTELYADGQALYLKLAEAYFNVAKVASYSYTWGISAAVVSVSYSESPAAGMSSLVQQIGQAMDSTANFMLLAAAEYSFLSFFRSAALVMLPVGIFLRSFSLTRKIGAVVLAAVIASAVIYPAAIVLAREVYHSFAPEFRENLASIYVASAGNPPHAGSVCSPYMALFTSGPLGAIIFGETAWHAVISPPICAVTTIFGAYDACMKAMKIIIFVAFYLIKSTFAIIVGMNVLEPYASTLRPADTLIANYYTPLSTIALPATAKYTVLSLITFLAPIIITMTFLRNLTIAFGGEPQLYGLSKLV